MLYAARLNSFKTPPELFAGGQGGKLTITDLLSRAGSVRGLGAVDLNYPDHFEAATPREIAARAADAGLTLNGFAMRYYTDPGFKADWTILNAGRRRLTADESKAIGIKGPVLIAQSLARKIVVILGTEYAGEMKKSIFYAMNYDMPEAGVFPMHCSCNADRTAGNPNAALFFASDLSSNITGVTSAAGKTGEVSAEVLNAAKALAHQSESLRTEVDSFLTDIKQAA